METFSTQPAVLKIFPAIFFQKFAEFLGQHLKSLVWKIMSYIIHPIKITPRFCKLSFLVFFVFFMSYVNRNHKDTAHPQGRRLDTILYIDQNVSQACQPEFLKICSVDVFVQKNFFVQNSRLFLYYFSQYPHQQRFFGVLLIYWVFNAVIFILLYSRKKYIIW